MLRVFSALASGALFGAGLLVAGMVDTAKVQGWLDVFGDWDPTLAFVMGGAMIPMAIAWGVARRMQVSRLGTPIPFQPTSDPRPDRDLVLGSVLFGAGWALAGLCPGPALASVSFGGTGGIVFVAAMIAGMAATPSLRTQMQRFIPA